MSDNHHDTQGLPNPSPSIPWSLWSVCVNQSLALTQIGNKYPCAHRTIMIGLQWKWIPALPRHTGLLFSWPTGSCHGKQLSLDASWQPDSIASTISPRPQAFSRQIASSTLKSNLLPTTGIYQTNTWFPFVPLDNAVGIRQIERRTIKWCFDSAVNWSRSVSLVAQLSERYSKWRVEQTALWPEPGKQNIKASSKPCKMFKYTHFLSCLCET